MAKSNGVRMGLALIMEHPFKYYTSIYLYKKSIEEGYLYRE